MIALFGMSNFKLLQEAGQLDLYDLNNMTKLDFTKSLYEIEKKINEKCSEYMVTVFVYAVGHGAMRYKAPINYMPKV